MGHITRIKFLQSSSILAAASIAGPAFARKKAMPKLSFSSLGCSGWGFPQMVAFAASHGYQGIELRGILKELELDKCPEFSTPQSTQAAMALLKQNGLQLVDLGASCNLHIAAPEERKKNLDEAKPFIDLAAQTGCPYIRVFPNSLPKEQDRAAPMQRTPVLK